ncbi:MAG: hypothetical protein JJV97_04695 [SAR324 cluster bacterium]|nr:hypothetical protein [SAR324 cluster bacterium]
MSISNHKLLIEKEGSFLHYSSDGITREFCDISASLTEDCHRLIGEIQQDNCFFSKLSESNKKNTLAVLRDYGQQLYKAIVPKELVDSLYDYNLFYIYEKKTCHHHWEMLHDGQDFCINYIPILRAYQPKIVQSYASEQQILDRLLIYQFNCSFSSKIAGQGNKVKFFPKDKVCINPLYLANNRNRQLKVVNMGWLSRKIMDILKTDVPSIIIISAYFDAKGVIAYNEETNEQENISFYALSNILKNASLKGLKGVIFRFWDWQTNAPLPEITNWLANTGLEFAISIEGLLDEDILGEYLELFLNNLTASSKLARAHLKALARLSDRYHLALMTPYIKLYFIKNIESSFNVKIITTNTAKLISLRGNLFKKEQFVRYKFNESSFVHQISEHFNDNKNRPLTLATNEFHILEDDLYAWLVNLPTENTIGLSEIANGVDFIGLDSLEKMANSTQEIDFLDDMWRHFLLTDSNLAQSEQNLMIVPPNICSKESFNRWFKKKPYQGLVMVNLRYLRSQEKPTKFDLTKKLSPSEVFRNFSITDDDNYDWANLSSSRSPFSGNPLWQGIFCELDKDNFKKLLSLGRDDFYNYLLYQIREILSSEEFQFLVTLYLFKIPLPKEFLLSLFDANSAYAINLAKLIKLDLVFISFDKKECHLNPAYQHLFVSYNFIKDDQLLKSAKKLIIMLDGFNLDKKLTAKQIFLMSNNFSQTLAFKGDYQSAINVLLMVQEKLIKCNDFTSEYLLILGMNIMNWFDHLEAAAMPEFSDRSWRVFFETSLGWIPHNLAIKITKLAIDKFSHFEQWAPYSLATAYLAGLSYQKSDNRIFLSLAKEAVQTSKTLFGFCYFDVNISILKSLSTNNDRQLFDEFAKDFKYEHDLISHDPFRKRDLALLDLWYSLEESAEIDIFKAFERFNIFPAYIRSKLELMVTWRFLKLAYDSDKENYLIHGWQNILKIATFTQDNKTMDKACHKLFYLKLKAEDKASALKYAFLLLKRAKKDYDLTKIKFWSDKVAMIYFKVGNTAQNTEYYAISKNPSLLYLS